MPLSNEDKTLFQELMKTVTPLNTPTAREPRAKPTQQFIIRKKEPFAPPPIRHQALSNYYTDIVHADSILSYCSHSLPRKRLIELKKGNIRWEGRLDLHGLTPDAAQHALCTFIETHHHNAHRCVLIIHGKGGRFHEAPILKNHVNHWLKQLPQVLAFHSAQAQEGGSGALYVLLKKNVVNAP